MSRRVLLGKGGSDHGLFISKIGVDVVDDSGNLCDKDLMIFDSREKGYAQVIKKGTLSLSKGTTTSTTFSSIPIPNAVVLLYAGGAFVELTSVSDFAFSITIPSVYPDVTSGLGYSLRAIGNSYTQGNIPNTTTVNYIVLRGYA